MCQTSSLTQFNYINKFITLYFKEDADYNVIAVSWKYGASYVRYPQSASNTRTVGSLTAQIIQKLVAVGGAKYDKVWCIGHSLGSHMCAHAGGATPEKIGRITGTAIAKVYKYK